MAVTPAVRGLSDAKRDANVRPQESRRAQSGGAESGGFSFAGMGGNSTTEGLGRRRVVVSRLAAPPHSPDEEHEHHAGGDQHLLARQNDVVAEEIEFEHSRLKRSVTARPYLIPRLRLIVRPPAARRRAAAAVHSGPPVPLGNEHARLE